MDKIDNENLCKTLFQLGKDLTRCNKVSFGKVETMIQNAKDELENLTPDENTISQEIELNENLEEFFDREKDLWK